MAIPDVIIITDLPVVALRPCQGVSVEEHSVKCRGVHSHSHSRASRTLLRGMGTRELSPCHHHFDLLRLILDLVYDMVPECLRIQGLPGEYQRVGHFTVTEEHT